MRPIVRHYGTVAATLALWLGAGCTLVSDLDRFEAVEDGGSAILRRDSGTGAATLDAATDAAQGDASGSDDDGGTVDAGPDAGTEPGLGCDNPRTLCVRLTRFTPHVDQLTVVDLVSEGDNLRARAVLDPLNGVDPTADVVMPLAIHGEEVPGAGEDHPLHLEIWADNDEDRVYTPNSDHDWDISLPPSGNRVFEHNTLFRDLEPRPRSIGGDFTMSLTDMVVHSGQMLEVMVIEDDSDRTVGLYRLQSIPASGQVDITIAGIIDVGTVGGINYRVEFYADRSGNRTYDDPGDDHAWRILTESTADGLHVDFEHGTMFSDLDYQFDFEE